MEQIQKGGQMPYSVFCVFITVEKESAYKKQFKYSRNQRAKGGSCNFHAGCVQVVENKDPDLTPARIVRGNALFLYGEKEKAYLRKGARPLKGKTELPNDRVGWGVLCVSESLPT